MKTCLFSVSYAGLWGQDRLRLEDFIPKAAALGYTGIEIMCKKPHLYPFNAPPESVERLRELIAKSGLEVACLAAYTNFTAGSESREVPFVDLQVSYVRSIGAIAQALGTKLVRIFTGYDNTHEPFGIQWQNCVKAVQECCDAVREYEVTIGIQNHHDIAVDTKSLLEFYYEVNRQNLGLMVDAWSMHLRGEDLRKSLALVKDKIVFSTVADYVVLKRHRYHPGLVAYEKLEPSLVKAVPMGTGEVDYPSYFAALREIGYNGWVSYETCSPLRGGGAIANLDRYAGQFLAYMKNIR